MTAIRTDRQESSAAERTDVAFLWRHAVVIGVAIVLVPLVVSAVAALVDPPVATIRDHALTEMRLRDIGFHPVDLGLYSRDGWSHPGPLVFFTLVAPYRIFGGRPVGMEIGALLVNGGAVVGMVAVGRRLGGTRAALAILLVASVVMRGLGAQLVRDPWVCFVTTLPFGLFLCVVWAMAERRTWSLPLAAFLASWLTQAHVGFAPLTLPLLGLGALVLTVRVWRDPDCAGRRRLLRAAGVTIAVLVVAWALPVWDQVHGRGNLEAIVRWFGRAGGETHTFSEGVRIVLGQLATVPDWVAGRRRVSAFNGEALLRTQLLWPLLLVPFAGAIVVAWRRREHAALSLAAVIVVGTGLGIAAVARTVGVMYEYRLLWTWILAALAVAVVVWVLWSVVAARRTEADVVIATVVLVALAGVAVAQTVQVASAGRADWSSPAVASVGRQLAHRFDPHAGQIVLLADSADSDWYLQGVLVDLERRGFTARIPDDVAGVFGGHRVADRGRIQARLRVVAAHEVGTLSGRPPGLVAYAGPRPLAAQERFLRRLDARGARLLADYRAGRIDSDELTRRFLALRAGPGAVAIVEEPAP